MNNLASIVGSFSIRVMLFVFCCIVVVFVVGLVAGQIFEDASKDRKTAPSDAEPPQPSAGPAAGA
jgi:hypothetical protein